VVGITAKFQHAALASARMGPSADKQLQHAKANFQNLAESNALSLSKPTNCSMQLLTDKSIFKSTHWRIALAVVLSQMQWRRCTRSASTKCHAQSTWQF